MHFSIDRTVHTTAFDKPVVDTGWNGKPFNQLNYLLHIFENENKAKQSAAVIVRSVVSNSITFYKII